MAEAFMSYQTKYCHNGIFIVDTFFFMGGGNSSYITEVQSPLIYNLTSAFT